MIAVTILKNTKLWLGEFRNAAYNNVLALYNMYNYQCNYWSTLLNISGKDPSGEDLAEKAFSWLEENSDYTQSGIEENDEVIRDSYKEIILMEIDGREAEELDEAERDMYDNYTTAYSTITNASGDLDSFKSVASNAINSFNKTDDTVKLLLGIDE